MCLIICVISILLLKANLNIFASEVQSSAEIRLHVVQSLHVDKVQDLNLGEVTQGSLSRSISPLDEDAAIFNVSGSPGHTYSISLPEKKSVKLKGSNGNTIVIEEFSSYPPEGNHGLLDLSGHQQLRVAASHGDIPEDFEIGEYFGQFTIELSY